MRHTYKIFLLGICGFFAALSARAQDPHFTQFYANPLYLNPALAGNKVCPRVNVSYRMQWPGIYGTYSTVGVSVDKLAYKLKGGVGLMIMNDRAAKGTLNTTGVGLIYAPQVQLSKRVSATAAIQAGYWQKALNWSKLTFGDEIDPQRGFVYETNEVQGKQSVGNFDLSAGILISSKHLFAGAALHHILEPNESFLGGNSPLPRKLTIHAGANIPLNKGSREDEVSISPNILFMKQGDFTQLNLGLYAKKGSIVGGMWYRGNDSFIILLGMEVNAIRLGYSYDVTISKLTNASAGAHEVTLGYQFSCKKPPIKYRPGICPAW
ncbi:MAG: type IX secretion system membrane protein PorP/SprF [Bacteroidota bacterium]|nr:type IX secretion system membrane protein PorP/SprF [Bacteroidota bacterium]